jgi:hypothetical protein
MSAIEYMLDKYSHMAATKDQPMPKNPKDAIYKTTLTNEEKRKIWELRDQNLSHIEIGDAIGRSHTSVCKVLKTTRPQ